MLRNNCNCGCNNVQSCTCKISTTTSNCNSTCTPMVPASNFCVAVPNPPAVPSLPNVSSNPTVTVESLLTLIEVKCDKTMCKKLQTEIDALYVLLQAVKPVPVTPATPVVPTVPGGTTPTVPVVVAPIAIPPVAFQLIANMTESLSGDLTSLYPSAELLKLELRKLWKCLSDKQQHHGKWVDNFTYRDILHQAGDACVTSLSPTTANTIKVITPVDVGSTVFNTIEGRECLFESLVDNNTTEPTKLSVLDGLWINYCDIKDVIDCVLPRTKITDCHQACDDPNQDGVFEDRTMCERVACIEAQICDTECVAGVPTLCERVTTIEACTICTVVDTDSVNLSKVPNVNGIGNGIKADVIISPDAGNTISVHANGLYSAPNDGLPAGAVTFVDNITGSFDVPVNKTTTWVHGAPGGTGANEYAKYIEFNCNEKTFSKAQYPYLTTTGKKVIMTMFTSIGYFMDTVDTNAIKSISPYQWDTAAYVNGSRVKGVIDSYGLNKSGHNSGLADMATFEFITNNSDLVVKVCDILVVAPDSLAYNAADILKVDMGTTTVTFNASNH